MHFDYDAEEFSVTAITAESDKGWRRESTVAFPCRGCSILRVFANGGIHFGSLSRQFQQIGFYNCRRGCDCGIPRLNQKRFKVLLRDRDSIGVFENGRSAGW
jgi:hypothetical protein